MGVAGKSDTVYQMHLVNKKRQGQPLITTLSPSSDRYPHQSITGSGLIGGNAGSRQWCTRGLLMARSMGTLTHPPH